MVQLISRHTYANHEQVKCDEERPRCGVSLDIEYTGCLLIERLAMYETES